MSRRGKSEDLFNGQAKVWLFLEAMPGGEFVPRAASLAVREKDAELDMELVCGNRGPMVCVRANAAAVADSCLEIPVYFGAKEGE